MRRVLLDANVVLDLFLYREPFLREAAALWDAAERGHLDPWVAAITPTTASYLITKAYNRGHALSDVEEMVRVCSVAPVGAAEISRALADLRAAAFSDFEDAVQHAAAESAGAEAIVTRNARDFAGARLPVLSPAELLAAR